MTIKELKESVEKQQIYLNTVVTVINTVKAMAAKATEQNVSLFIIDELLNFHAQYVNFKATLEQDQITLKELEDKIAKKKPCTIERIKPKKDDDDHKT